MNSSFATKYRNKKGKVVGEYVPTKKQLVCLTCTLPANQCNGEKSCMKRQAKKI